MARRTSREGESQEHGETIGGGEPLEGLGVRSAGWWAVPLLDAADRVCAAARRSTRSKWGMGLAVLACSVSFTQIFTATGGPKHAAAGGTVEIASAPPPSTAWSAPAREARAAADDATTLELAGLQDRFETVARKVAPSVVAISVAIESGGDEDTLRPDDMTGRRLAGILEKTTRTVGTGFFISADGLVLTNEHVVAEAEQLWITTDDGRVLPAYVVATDPRQDLAVLRVPPPASGRTYVPVRFVDPAHVRRGNWAIALGNPYGLASEGRLAMSVGVVSATGRALPRLSSRENKFYVDLIQTTAEINPGNSGGPLFDVEGRVFAVNTAVVLPQKNTNGIGFALPANASLLARIDQLARGNEIAYGDLGISVSEPSARQRKAAGIDRDLGVRVDDIDAPGPASGLLREGDLITALAGTEVSGVDAFTTEMIAAVRAGVPVRLTVVRSGKPVELALTPRHRPGPADAVTKSTQRYRWNGMLVGPIPAHWPPPHPPAASASNAGAPASNPVGSPSNAGDSASNPGAFRSTTGVRGGPAGGPASGLLVLATDHPLRADAFPVGTVIQSINGKPLRDLADLQSALAAGTASQIVTWSPPTSPDTRTTADLGR